MNQVQRIVNDYATGFRLWKKMRAERKQWMHVVPMWIPVTPPKVYTSHDVDEYLFEEGDKEIQWGRE